MEATAHVSVSNRRSRFVEAYEAGGRHGSDSLSRFLPPRTDPEYLWVLEELVRSDLQHQWDDGVPARVADYVTRYPDLLSAPAALRSLAAEERRWREQHGLATHPDRWDDHLTPGPALCQTPAPSGRLDLGCTIRVPPPPNNLADGPLTGIAHGIATQRTDRPAADLPVSASESVGGNGRPVGPFPKVGDRFFDFELLSELGSGAFARVFLAEQIGLARRQVALKVTTKPTREPQRLARLRHTNIVPIYSVHDQAPLQAVCMPFLGRQTLADLIKAYRETGTIPLPSHHNHSTAAIAHDSTVVNVPHTPQIPAEKAPATIDELPAIDPFDGLSHQEVVAWLMGRLAEGLAHAHDRGILHLDLKPANVLFADDGQPLLLDFNLSYDVRSGDRERHGGTLPYMAPEQIEEFRDGGPTRVDHRTDLYAVGVIFYELLTGRHPFPMPDAPADKKHLNLSKMAAIRRAAAPSARAIDTTVSPALDAVVRKLMAPNPADRYESARDLVIDLDRHRHHLPLKFAANPSIQERAVKWLRRNPRAPFHALLAAAVLATGGLAFAAYRHSETQSRAEAQSQYRGLRNALATLRVDLAFRDEEVNRNTALDTGREWLAAYRLPDRADWADWPAVADLPPSERMAVAADLGELAMLMAHAEWLDSRAANGDEAAADRARHWHRVAAACFTGRPVPPVMLEQQKWLGLPADTAAGLPRTAAETAADLYLRAAERIAHRSNAEAVVLLDRLTSLTPDHFAAHFALGRCKQAAGRTPEALERFQIAQVLAPTDPRPAYHRGQMLQYVRRWTEAEAAFSDAVRRCPTHGASYRNRAIVRSRMTPGNLRGAADDLAKAAEYGISPLQTHLLRADVFDKLGDTVAAARERTLAAGLTPTNPMDHVVRGTDRVTADPSAALADFARAAELRPDYLIAWQNQAHILSEKLGRLTEAVAAQEKAAAVDRRFAPAHSGLAVLLARAGRRPEAHEAAERALILSDEPSVTYQAACTFALTSIIEPNDADRAFRLLRQAFRDGYRNFAVIDTDPDLDPLRDTVEFESTLRAAREMAR